MISIKDELSVVQDCLLRGERVVVPRSLRHKVLDVMHDGHPGKVRMKLIARGLVWWPHIDRDIEYFVSTCESCQRIDPQYARYLEKWPQTGLPFERIHVDFFYYRGHTFLVLFDSYSKWMDIVIMKRTDAISVIAVLQKIFSCFGLPSEMVTDNGPPFRSSLFKRFCAVKGVKLTEPAALHPQSNGAAERCVRTSKTAFKKMLLDNKFKSISLESLVNKFLYEYRNTPSTTTKRKPSEMIFSYKTRTLLDMLRPQLENNFCDNTEGKGFHINDKVWFKSHNSNSHNWIPATVRSRISKVMYFIVVQGAQKRAHRDQLKIRRERLPFIDCNRPAKSEKLTELCQEDKARPPKRKQTVDIPSPKRLLRPREHLKRHSRFCDIDYQ